MEKTSLPSSTLMLYLVKPHGSSCSKENKRYAFTRQSVQLSIFSQFNGFVRMKPDNLKWNQHCRSATYSYQFGGREHTPPISRITVRKELMQYKEFITLSNYKFRLQNVSKHSVLTGTLLIVSEWTQMQFAITKTCKHVNIF
jgi:hypothetical protein